MRHLTMKPHFHSCSIHDYVKHTTALYILEVKEQVRSPKYQDSLHYKDIAEMQNIPNIAEMQI